jgi:hypothetical protein
MKAPYSKDEQDYCDIVLEIEDMLSEEDPDYKRIVDICDSLLQSFFIEIKLREANGTLDHFLDKNEMCMYSICLNAGLSAFLIAQEDVSYLPITEEYLSRVPDNWHSLKHITLAKVYLFKAEYDLALLQMEYHLELIDDISFIERIDDDIIKRHKEISSMGFAAIYYAKGELTKFYEYFDLYVARICSEGGYPKDEPLLLTSFFIYFELNTDNQIFIEKLLPLCQFMENVTGIKYDLWIQSEIAYEAGRYEDSIELAKQFKASHKDFIENESLSFEEGWIKMFYPEDSTGVNWSPDNFLHPAMAEYECLAIGERVDRRINQDIEKMKLDRIDVTKTMIF